MNGVNLEYNQLYLDFGAGFYATPSYEHAAITAMRKTDKINAREKVQEEPYIVEFTYIPKKDIKLDIRMFQNYCEEWGSFVLNNRLTTEILKEYNISEHNQNGRYDICIGKIADGKVVNIAYHIYPVI